MTDGKKNNVGCWTCRLRRKRCDLVRPVCGICSALEICCYSDPDKPEWMDNGVKQRQMVLQLKTEVKKRASRRRSKRLIQRVARDLEDEEEAPTPKQTLDITAPSTQQTNGRAPNEDQARRSSPPDYVNETRPASESAAGFTQISLEHLDAQGSHRLSNELELSFIMVFLDYTFPVLFPLYTPTIFEGGRGWLLVLPMKIRALYHTVISLTSYFFTEVPISSGAGYERCTNVAFGEQSKQLDLAVKMVQRDLHTINQGVHSNILESVYLLESIVQLLIYDGVVATTENWRMHLGAAIVLFEQIISCPGSVSSLFNLMSQLSPLPTNSENWNGFWTADQAAFRFFSAILLVADIISSTALEQSPTLQKYHHDLLTNHPGPEKAPLQLEDFIGCQNWVLCLISEIAVLDTWKKDMKKHRSLNMTQLVERGSLIEQELQTGFSQLDHVPETQYPPQRPPDMFPFNGSCTSSTTNTVTRIWAHAARIYLHTVLSGWQTATPEICEDVSQTVNLFKELSPGVFRALAWPFCVAGCLAAEEQESAFRELVNSMGPLGMIGTMQSALCIMENVWRKRAHVDPDTWDIAACSRSLGHVVLFI